jgi:tRNA G26 N,N-dimethylase Trm1
MEGSYWSCGSLQAFQESRFAHFYWDGKIILNDVSKEHFKVVDVNVSSVEKNVNIMNIQNVVQLLLKIVW